MAGNPYESRQYRDEYLLFHYGQPRAIDPLGIVPVEALRFHERVVAACVKPHLSGRVPRGLDIGCAVGRQAFELARYCREVLAVDRSESFIRAANRIKQHGHATVRVREEGNRSVTAEARIPKRLPRDRVTFRVGDAQALERTVNEPVDVALAVNLICRLPRPSAFISQLPGLVKPGGLLVIGGPFSWLEEYTAPSEWIRSDQLSDLLVPAFKEVDQVDLPFAIREHRRKFQLVVSSLGVYRRE
jgi:SAM-dependent methyltransferase